MRHRVMRLQSGTDFFLTANNNNRASAPAKWALIGKPMSAHLSFT
jgi:hypothetical protein